MAKKARRELTSHEKACAERAKKLWETKRKLDGIANQNAPADALAITQSAFSQFINGNVPMPAEMKAKMAKYFGVSIKDIDPDFYAHIGLPDPDLDDIERDALKQLRLFKGKDKAVLLGFLLSGVSEINRGRVASKDHPQPPVASLGSRGGRSETEGHPNPENAL